MKKETLQNLALLITSVLFTLLVAEVGFRIMAYRNSLQSLENLSESYEMPPAGEEATIGSMIRISKNPRIIYEFIPNLDVTFLGQPVHTNALGFRGDQIAPEKPENTIRIVGIGDSQMFGWGVADGEEYLAVLSKKLNENCPTHSWEVVNTGVPGYNTVMELETLRSKGLVYQPNYVIVGFIGNDFALPNFIRGEDENFYTLKKSFMVSYFRETATHRNLTDAPIGDGRVGFESDPEKVPAEYQDMVGESAVLQALEELKELSVQHDFEVIFFMDNWYRRLGERQKRLQDACRDLGFNFVSGYHIWDKFAEKDSLPDPQAARFLSETDPHASALSHRATGQYLAELIQSKAFAQGQIQCSH